ncbi:MAG: tetratricopeptide repeat protein [Methanotrichaceae archaeon]|nr:tetratricopeptide repeat protein [Methanotrichaceae archaeon]
MDQLIVLQGIYESFSKGKESLQSFSSSSIEGDCSVLVGKLLDRCKNGRVDENICSKLTDALQDTYELKRLGDICRKSRFFELAIKCYNRALAICRDQTVRPILLNNMGQVYALAGNQRRAIVYFLKAVDGFETIGDLSGVAHIMGNLASAYRRSQEWDKAIECSSKSLKIFEQIGDEFGTAQMTGSLGRIYSEMGRRDLAEEYFGKSLNDFRRLGDERSVAWILDKMGNISSENGSRDEAQNYFTESLKLFEELGQEQGSGIALSNIGRMHLEKGDHAAAKNFLERAMKLLSKDMQPAYQNNLALMAANYSLLARKYVEEAEKAKLDALNKRRDHVEEDKLRIASQYYARASDHYQELASFPRTQMPEIGVSASFTRSLSYLALLQSGTSENEAENEAIVLAERAISALNGAVANAQHYERDQVEAFQGVLKGIKEVLSADSTEKDPRRLTKSLFNSIEFMMAAAHQSGEVNACLCGALQSLNAAVDEEQRKGDPSRYLGAVASQLRLARKHFQTNDTEQAKFGAFKMDEAARQIDALTGIAMRSSQYSYMVLDSANYQDHKSALLAIGWALLINYLNDEDITGRIFYWDESFNLVESKPFAAPSGKNNMRKEKEGIQLIRETPDGSQIYSAKETDSRLLLPMKTDDARTPWSNLFLQKQKDSSTIESSETIRPEKDLTTTRVIGSSQSITEDIMRNQQSKAVRPLSPSLASEENFKQKSQANSIINTSESSFEQEDGVFTRRNGLKLIKAEAILVLILMAIDGLLYLI